MPASVQRQNNIRWAFIICAGALLFKAAQLQLFNREFRQRADATTIDKLTVYPSRGLIYDRNNKLMVNNTVLYDLMVTYNQLDDDMKPPNLNTKRVQAFCDLLDIEIPEYLENLDKDWRSGRFSYSVPFVFKKKLADTTYAALQERLYKYPGFFVQLRNIRGYSFPVGAHVLGYINEVDQRDIERSQGLYKSGDYIGAAGIESEYEHYLKGEKGTSFQLKDNLGRIVGSLDGGKRDTLAESGSDLTTSIDLDLQVFGEMLMQNKTGSIVAIEPATGDILAMVSAPTYDPSLLTMNDKRGEVFSDLLTNPLKPFFDRTVMAKYPPGSIFKTVVALAGMEEGTLSPNRGMSCDGGYFYAGRLYKCHGHGRVRDVEDAIAFSCNTFFFAEFRDLVDQFGFKKPHQGLANFNKYCTEMGLGTRLGIDYPNESRGNIPTPEYYDKVYKPELGGWRSPTIMSVGIGQGELQLTTLQMANLAALIANRGYWYPPHLAKTFKDGTPIPSRFHEKRVISIKKSHFETVVQGMAECVNKGTARSCAIPGIQVCGKTGTSQNPHGDDHSVFFAFAPKEKPRIAIAVYVENAGWGASYAAPIASLMIEKYINRTIMPERQYMVDRMTQANLIDKYLKNRKLAKEAVKNPKPEKRDTLPKPESLPVDKEE